MMKMIANLSDVPQKYLLTGDIRADQKQAVSNAMVRIKNLYKPIIYDDVYSMDEIRLKAKKHKLQDNINIVALDYVQNLRGKGSLFERMEEAAWQLYALGKELGVTVIALSPGE